MKKIAFIILILKTTIVLCQTNHSNSTLPEFLLGMFNDYNGVDFIPSHPKEKDLITDFWCSDKNKSELFLDSISKYNKLIDGDIEVVNDGNIKFYSKSLSRIFRNYFNIKKKTSTWLLDESNGIEEEYGIYKGKLKKSGFNTLEKKLSFLKGVIYVHGEFIDKETVILRFANSPNHFSLTKKFLKNLGVRNIKIKECDKGYVPCVRNIEFKIEGKYSSHFTEMKEVTNQIQTNVNDCE